MSQRTSRIVLEGERLKLPAIDAPRSAPGSWSYGVQSARAIAQSRIAQAKNVHAKCTGVA